MFRSERVAPGSRTSDYDYALPADRIAQRPNEQRDRSRLMIVDRTSGTIEHGVFADVARLVAPGDGVVLNTTRVIRARLLGRRPSGAPAEVLLLRRLHGDGRRFEALVHPGGKLRPGRVVTIDDDLRVVIEAVTPRRTRVVRLDTPLDPDTAIDRFGHVPLPPYITRPDASEDAEHYQTVYARERGSVAAPTAGLHLTHELLEALARRGAIRVDVVLHVGAGTFKPVECDDPAAHEMHEEWYEVSEQAAGRLGDVRSAGGRIWAVGTTSARVLETVAGADGAFHAGSGDTRLFIRPPYQWRGVDRLITNFHLPRSTLLMLVAAFAGYDLTMHAYRVALESGYRFYSYGDAMAIR
jgi:S-adenosylmethionine:tRNA ribosyltransferase-isomerase